MFGPREATLLSTTNGVSTNGVILIIVCYNLLYDIVAEKMRRGPRSCPRRHLSLYYIYIYVYIYIYRYVYIYIEREREIHKWDRH